MVPIWTQLWKLYIPPSVRTFIWRASQNILPLRGTLLLKKVDVPPWCPFCLQASESLLHLMVTCSFTRQVWQCSFLGWFSPTVSSFQEWLGRVWTARNDLIWHHRVTAPLSIWTRTLCSYHDWSRAQVEATPPRPTEGATIWQPPTLAWVKVNVDVVTVVDGSSTGYGCIARDSSGSVLRVRIGRLEGAFRPKIAEALAIKEALSWIECTRWSRVIVEGD
ncbi:hypothetical protein K2173_004255 [Erythroxylum novogranatense]|uniref:Reverse transcriptase zinc-binding domain-containing protein n=1 Tax=Erythroxylum novogranatense TaxID=1862640 RepID=A0AAV8TRD3_9ROSI|nr:hypothetical protein K2173_004255 [Erythroxylum novogranatense]